MFAHYSNEPVFNVKAMARQTGVAAATLRAWERRYGVPSPPRTDSGYRLYSARDVAITRWLKSQLENGLSISQAVHLLRSIELQSSNGHAPSARQVHSATPSSLQRLQDDIVAAALEFDEERIEVALGEAFSLFTVEEVCLNVVQPVLVTLGDKWHSGEVNVSVEHFATNIMRRKLLTLMASAPAPTHDARIVSACAPGEYHEIGILMISLFLRRTGYNVIYLGQNIAMARLEEMLAKIRPDLLLVSASGLLSAANLLDIIAHVRARPANDGPMLAYGGRVFNRMPELQAQVSGKYVGNDADQAIAEIGQLLAETRDAPFRPPAAAPAPAPRAGALSAFRLLRPEIVAAAARDLQQHDGHALDYRRAAEACENVLNLLDAVIRLDRPDVLRDPLNWTWEAMPPDGMGAPQMQRCTDAIAQAARMILPPAQLADLEPFFAALDAAFARP